LSELEDLQKTVQELKTQVSVLSRRITDLDDSMSDHIGLDWGETLTDANSPHPNMSVNTLESGGGAIRQDQHGMQVSTGGTEGTAIYFVDELEPNPTGADPAIAAIRGSANDSTGATSVKLYVANLEPPNATVTGAQSEVLTTTGDVARVVQLVYVGGDLTGGGPWSETWLNRVYNQDAGTFMLWQALLRLCPQQGNGYDFTSDPANAIEGDIWYNTTDNQFKFYEGSTIKTLGGGGMSVIVKEADETISSNNTLQNDDELLFAVAANEVYQFEGVLMVSTGATPDIKLTFAGPTGAVGSFSWEGADSSANRSFASAALGATTTFLVAGTPRLVRFWGGIHNGANAGNLTLQWAQNTSDGTNTTVLAGSYLKYQLES